ncbi:hypothetical protein CXB51_035994 [Gossypium anomalum]|uniref:Magnesium transporter n=1 Tax=Gossypium anomalum TaxID=47600 RepID=A0A8J6CMX5_9ROSI|nr:hypothetical protein CXB51_035994 [Gossypium anomalum]
MQGVSTMDVSDSERHVLASEQLLPVPEVVCSFLDKNVANLERDAYPALDELARNVSTKNLEHVRSLKSSLTHLLARVQKQSEAVLSDAFSNSIAINPPHLRQLGSNRSRSLSSHFFDDHNVEDLGMLLEACFMQLDGIRNKILSKTMSISYSTASKMELIQLQLTLTIASIETLVAGWMGMNIPCALYQKNGIFDIFTEGITLGCLLIFLLVLEYARWTKLIDA